MVRFIIGVPIKNNEGKTLIYIPIWLDLLYEKLNAVEIGDF